MRAQRGFILPPLGATVYAAIAAGAVILALGVAVKIQSSRLAAVKAEYAGFVAQTKALGDVAAAKAKAQEAADKQRKEKADAENAKAKQDLAGMYAAYRSLRDGSSRGSGVSAAPTFTASTDRTCFDSKALVASIRGYETGILQVLQQGDSAIVDLNTAKAWAQRP